MEPELTLYDWLAVFVADALLGALAGAFHVNDLVCFATIFTTNFAAIILSR